MDRHWFDRHSVLLIVLLVAVGSLVAFAIWQFAGTEADREAPVPPGAQGDTVASGPVGPSDTGAEGDITPPRHDLEVAAGPEIDLTPEVPLVRGAVTIEHIDVQDPEAAVNISMRLDAGRPGVRVVLSTPDAGSDGAEVAYFVRGRERIDLDPPWNRLRCDGTNSCLRTVDYRIELPPGETGQNVAVETLTRVVSAAESPGAVRVTHTEPIPLEPVAATSRSGRLDGTTSVATLEVIYPPGYNEPSLELVAMSDANTIEAFDPESAGPGRSSSLGSLTLQDAATSCEGAEPCREFHWLVFDHNPYRDGRFWVRATSDSDIVPSVRTSRAERAEARGLSPEDVVEFEFIVTGDVARPHLFTRSAASSDSWSADYELAVGDTVWRLGFDGEPATLSPTGTTSGELIVRSLLYGTIPEGNPVPTVGAIDWWVAGWVVSPDERIGVAEVDLEISVLD